MICPDCGKFEDKVVETRESKDGKYIRRRYSVLAERRTLSARTLRLLHRVYESVEGGIRSYLRRHEALQVAEAGRVND